MRLSFGQRFKNLVRMTMRDFEKEQLDEPLQLQQDLDEEEEEEEELLHEEEEEEEELLHEDEEDELEEDSLLDSLEDEWL